ncbi:hypothetical protein JIN85_09185 [Luteolibacter pohnpeiensis]|uniref:L,D-TPase catalytic domain-containing protein n=1 Tax=Luteolibacter pohnpeiensis TaxID=454153 RepID=A0A934SC59_9BACT|nr:L,D-transpeptidase family protein [Luteolibacter pohnpeiensis]MBK1882588.1 hypothetical protein [Luteolibacter pohnpeiensis]
MHIIPRTAIAFLATALLACGFELPKSSTQCVLGIADDWDSSQVTLRLYQKSGGSWKATGESWKARLGKKGLVWGLGLHPNPSGATVKKEGDGRSPAGVFAIGGAWGYDRTIQKNPKLFYHQVTPRDLWVEDPKSPQYNHTIVLDHDPATKWEKAQQMRQGDYAHSLKLFIAHNAPPHVSPGRGSAIFFHIWRGGGSVPTAGCTSMPEEKLRSMISRINPDQKPLYVLLPKSEYQKHKADWKLP